VAVQTITVQLWDGTTWIDQPTYSEGGSTVTRGSDADSTLRPLQILTKLNNDDNRFDTTDPVSPLYALAKRYARWRLLNNAVVVGIGEAQAYALSKTIDHVAGANRGKSSCDLRVEGTLARVLSWSTPLRSALYRRLARFYAATTIGYWPFEDGRAAGQLSNAVPNGKPGSAAGITYQGDAGSGGSAELAELTVDTVATGPFVKASATAGWQIGFTFKLAALPATQQPLLTWYTSDNRTWLIEVKPVGYQFTSRNTTTGAVVWTAGVTFGSLAAPNDSYITFRIKATRNAGTGIVTVEPAWYSQQRSGILGTTGTFSDTIGYLLRWRLTGNAVIDKAAFGHLYAVTGGGDDLLADDTIAAANGHTGERAGSRFVRLCAEEGFTVNFTGSVTDTMPMGPQKPATLAGLLEQIVATDDCYIYDSRTTGNMVMRTRVHRYGQTPVMALTFPAQVVDYDKVNATERVKNVVTIAQAEGSEATASLTTGPLSTLPAPAGIGEAKGDLTVSVADQGRLADLASWYLAKWTIDRAWYRSITIDLVANPSLINDANFLFPGDTITVAGIERETVRLTVVGLVEQHGHATRTVTIKTIPADTDDILRYDTVGDRWGAATTTLAGALTTSTTALPFTSTDPKDRWLTTGMPFDIVIAGERMTLLAMTAAVGTGPYTQTGTVNRAVNGVVKAHTAGTPIQVFDAARWAL
jgi:hypothetical protein